MKKTVLLFLGLLAIAAGCMTRTELTDSDKDVIVRTVKETSAKYWNFNEKMDLNEMPKYFSMYDENSDSAWQTEPVSVVFNTQILNTHAEWADMYREMYEKRSAMNVSVVNSHFNVLSADKVLEVNKVDFTVTTKDSIVHGPYTGVNTILWVNIDGAWKMQFFHESTADKQQ